MKTPFSLIILQEMPILEQLQLEEALLRTSSGNYCLLNIGSPDAIVMGISGKAETLIDIDKVKKRPLPIIKRFSGGGTVYVDPDTLFVTFIGNHDLLSASPSPKAIHAYCEPLYASFFGKAFSLRENDYVFGEKKFGGNAQYLQKDRWLHHTSFLWDFDIKNMETLLFPERRPRYRQERSHADFLTTLKPLFSSKEALLRSFKAHLLKALPAISTKQETLFPFLEKPHRKASINIFPDLLDASLKSSYSGKDK